eukprot:CAMPEP_0194357978 /NCGR_PEP_ID=MMETSP0174-20130528/5364_1 /TAXON_ID=216777 /ORGANISM="Proboscia alata, Strain PI-D3" /LENGTH=530 /DNA_ID=CAMNT_0039128195 /DNA_START=24 /DNA_END=1616 /DNA_ORIENTATION=+
MLVERNTNIAFDIVLEREKTDAKTPIQKKLESWKRPNTSPEEIKFKLSKASKRRKKQFAKAVRKRALHHVAVQKARYSQKAINDSKLDKIEAKMIDKLEKAKANKERRIAIEVERISKATKDKMERGEEALKNHSSAMISLDERLDKKAAAASQKKEASIFEMVTKISATTRNKIARGTNAKNMIDARRKEILSSVNKRLISAESRREKIQDAQAQSIANTFKEAEKKRKEVAKQEYIEARKLEASLESKSAAAGHRRTKLIDRCVDEIATQNTAKMQRATEALKQQELGAKHLEYAIDSKHNLVHERKLISDMERLEKVALSTKIKLERGENAKMKAELISKELDKNLETKLISASARKEKSTNEKVQKLQQNSKSKQNQVNKAIDQVKKASLELETTMNKKLNLALKRKKAMTKDLQVRLSSRSTGKSPRETSPEQTLSLINERLDGARERRESFLCKRSIEAGTSSRKSSSEKKESKKPNLIYSPVMTASNLFPEETPFTSDGKKLPEQDPMGANEEKSHRSFCVVS